MTLKFMGVLSFSREKKFEQGRQVFLAKNTYSPPSLTNGTKPTKVVDMG